MDDDVIIIGDDGTEHVFPAGFDPKKAAAIVRGGAPKTADVMATPPTMAGVGAMATAPAILSGVNAASRGVIGAAGKVLPAIGYLAAANEARKGNVAGAFTTAGSTAGGHLALQKATPAVATAVARATGPVGPLASGARMLSRFAGAASIPAIIASLLYDAKQLVDEERRTGRRGPAFDLQLEARNARPFE